MSMAVEPSPIVAPKRKPVRYRPPEQADGTAIWELIRDSGSLDENSRYCNLLQCTHFADTCVVAEVDGAIAGWMSAYIPPTDPDALFVWQVAVNERARGHGIGKGLILDVLKRGVCSDVEYIHSTITADNAASWALFGSIADRLSAPMEREPYFRKNPDFDGVHDTEHLVRIGPFGAADAAKVAA